MSVSNGCPRDRSELLLLLEDRATESLRAHVRDCETCRLEVAELESTAQLLVPVAQSAPSDRVRREVLSYARSRLRGPAAGGAWWRAPAAAAAAVAATILSGTVAYARMGPGALEIAMPGSWTLVFAAVWGSALFLYAGPRERLVRREQLKGALFGASAFVVLVLLFPIPTAVQLCAEWLGAGRLGQSEAFWAFAITASLYACLASAIASCLRGGGQSRSDKRVVALLFTFLAAPLLMIQAATSPLIVIVGGILGLLCGASLGGRVR